MLRAILASTIPLPQHPLTPSHRNGRVQSLLASSIPLPHPRLTYTLPRGARAECDPCPLCPLPVATCPSYPFPPHCVNFLGVGEILHLSLPSCPVSSLPPFPSPSPLSPSYRCSLFPSLFFTPTLRLSLLFLTRSRLRPYLSLPLPKHPPFTPALPYPLPRTMQASSGASSYPL